MSVPPQIMQQLLARGGAGGGGPDASGGAQPPGAGGPGGGTPQGEAPPASPSAAPMSTPQNKKGLKASAQTNIHIAVNMLEEALPAFGSESGEGAKILAALKSLSGLIAKKDTSDLVPAEIMQMVSKMPQMGGGTDLQRKILQQMRGASQQQQAA